MTRILTATLAAAFAATTLAHADGRISYTADAGDMGQMQMTERWRGWRPAHGYRWDEQLFTAT